MKKAIVLGASSGIGRELAKLLADNNFITGITGRRAELLDELKNESPERFKVSCFDIQDVENIPENLNKLVKDLGGLDLFIISAGTGDINEELDFKIEEMTVLTNVSGFTAAACWAFNYFKNQNHGHLAGITSIAGIRGSSEAPAYNATKAFQINYLEGLRKKAANHHKIIVTDIRPGFVDTSMAKGEGLFWVTSAKKAAKQILNAINRKKKIAYITKRWAVIAMILKLLPKFVYDRMP